MHANDDYPSSNIYKIIYLNESRDPFTLQTYLTVTNIYNMKNDNSNDTYNNNNNNKMMMCRCVY